MWCTLVQLLHYISTSFLNDVTYWSFKIPYMLMLLKIPNVRGGGLSKLLASLMRNYFPKLPSGAPLHTSSKLYDSPVGFVAPFIWGIVLLYLRLPKGGCCSISDDSFCSYLYNPRPLTTIYTRCSRPACPPIVLTCIIHAPWRPFTRDVLAQPVPLLFSPV